jgi:hypothetical protein
MRSARVVSADQANGGLGLQELSMRLKSILAALVAVVSFALASPKTAQAFDRDRPDVPAGWGHERTVRHWVYYPRYHHVFLTHAVTDPAKADPFAYHYEPRGYYPYYNSGYWKNRREMVRNRPHHVQPKYYAGWGAKKKHYNHVEWHQRHHGRHDHAHW